MFENLCSMPGVSSCQLMANFSSHAPRSVSPEGWHNGSRGCQPTEPHHPHFSNPVEPRSGDTKHRNVQTWQRQRQSRFSHTALVSPSPSSINPKGVAHHSEGLPRVLRSSQSEGGSLSEATLVLAITSREANPACRHTLHSPAASAKSTASHKNAANTTSHDHLGVVRTREIRACR
jgi:hypothetical protein